jgi:hypothetical protein
VANPIIIAPSALLFLSHDTKEFFHKGHSVFIGREMGFRAFESIAHDASVLTETVKRRFSVIAPHSAFSGSSERKKRSRCLL